MHKWILFRTNLFVCLVIIAGFALIFAVDYRQNLKTDMQSIEHISLLTSNEIYYRLESIFSKPVSVSLGMANNRLLKALLLEENANNEDFVTIMQEYLRAYKEQNGYGSVFLVSAKTEAYYTADGIDRILREDNPENEWYYNFLSSGSECSLNVDNDESARNEITVFVNCAIRDDNGVTLGVVGVGMQVANLQSILTEYAELYGVDIYIINENGNIEIAMDNTGWQPEDFFTICGYPQYKDEILGNKSSEGLTYWNDESADRNYIVSRYIPSFGWHLLVEHDAAAIKAQIGRQAFTTVLLIILIIVIVTSAIAYTVGSYNKKIIALTVMIEREKHEKIKRELMTRADSDGSTGLLNKAATERYIKAALERNPGKIFGFYIIDIDDLKKINDKRGHKAGDVAIREFAMLIKNQFRDLDIIGRIGGDEFVAFARLSTEEQVVKKAKALSAALDAEYVDDSVALSFSASIGVAAVPRDGTEFDTIYKNADTALYEAKRIGKNAYVVCGAQVPTA